MRSDVADINTDFASRGLGLSLDIGFYADRVFCSRIHEHGDTEHQGFVHDNGLELLKRLFGPYAADISKTNAIKM